MNPTANEVEFESGRSFANQIRSSTRKVANEAVTNHFDQISKQDALDMLSGKMTEAEARLLLTDPRMSQWMKENHMNTEFDMDRMIQNRMVPNVRKITQNALGHGAILAKHTGADISWQPKRAVEKTAFVTEDETRLPQAIGQNGKGTLADTVVRDANYYANMIGKSLNNVSPIERITVGKGISADGSSSMNLHYGSALRADMLPDPGQQRSINVYKNLDNMDVSGTRPRLSQFASVPAPETVLPANKDARIETGNLQKFTSKDYTETVAPRNLFDVLNTNRFELERTPGQTLEHDPKQLATSHPNWNGNAQSRPTENTHAVQNKTVELERSNHGRSLKAAIDAMETEFIRHPEADPARSTQEIRINSERKYAATVASIGSGDATHDPRRLGSEKTFVPRPSHGGGLESVVGTNAYGANTQTSRGERTLIDMPVQMGKQFKSTETRTFGETTLEVQDRPETNYVTPGSRWGVGTTNVGPGDNANGKSEVRIKLVQEQRGLSKNQTSAGRPRSEIASVVTTRKLEMGGTVQRTQAEDESLRSERNKFMRPGSYSDPTKVGESTRGARKVSLREAVGMETAHAPAANVLII